MAASDMKLDQFMYTQARWPVVMIYQLTSPRTIQAFLVILFGLVVAYLTLTGQEIPDAVAYVLIAIVAFFFGDTREGAVLNGLRTGLSGQVSSAAAQGALVKVGASTVGETPKKE